MISGARRAGPPPMVRPCSRCGEVKRRHSFSADAWRTKDDDTRVCKVCRSGDPGARGPKIPTLSEQQLDAIRRELKCPCCEAYPQPQENGKIWTLHKITCSVRWES